MNSFWGRSRVNAAVQHFFYDADGSACGRSGLGACEPLKHHDAAPPDACPGCRMVWEAVDAARRAKQFTRIPRASLADQDDPDDQDDVITSPEVVLPPRV